MDVPKNNKLKSVFLAFWCKMVFWHLSIVIISPKFGRYYRICYSTIKMRMLVFYEMIKILQIFHKLYQTT